jgi:CHASE2 domain-containing sensor protein
MSRVLTFLRSTAAMGLLIGTLTGLGGLALRYGGHFQTLELAAYDRCIGQETRTAPADPRIIFITIT